MYRNRITQILLGIIVSGSARMHVRACTCSYRLKNSTWTSLLLQHTFTVIS